MAEMTTIRMTAEEFARLPESSQLTELIEGEVIVSPSGTLPHQATVLSVATFLTQHAPNGLTVIAPMDVHLDSYNVVQPDVLWVSNTNSNCRSFQDKYLVGPPDLVVEVLSPSTAKRDYGKKFELYEQSGVREYWLTDAVSQFVQVYANENGKFVRLGAFGVGEKFMSRVLGVEIEVRSLFGSVVDQP